MIQEEDTQTQPHTHTLRTTMTVLTAAFSGAGLSMKVVCVVMRLDGFFTAAACHIKTFT